MQDEVGPNERKPLRTKSNLGGVGRPISKTFSTHVRIAQSWLYFPAFFTLPSKRRSTIRAIANRSEPFVFSHPTLHRPSHCTADVIAYYGCEWGKNSVLQWRIKQCGSQTFILRIVSPHSFETPQRFLFTYCTFRPSFSVVVASAIITTSIVFANNPFSPLLTVRRALIGIALGLLLFLFRLLKLT